MPDFRISVSDIVKFQEQMMNGNSLFNKIVRGEIPADILYQDEQITAFRDKYPKAPTHILIVPNILIPNLNALQPQHQTLVGHMVLTAVTLARKEGVAAQGYRLIINCNQHGGQEVPHLHLHLVGGRFLGTMLSQ